jgi:hypothetical protein
MHGNMNVNKENGWVLRRAHRDGEELLDEKKQGWPNTHNIPFLLLLNQWKPLAYKVFQFNVCYDRLHPHFFQHFTFKSRILS